MERGGISQERRVRNCFLVGIKDPMHKCCLGAGWGRKDAHRAGAALPAATLPAESSAAGDKQAAPPGTRFTFTCGGFCPMLPSATYTQPCRLELHSVSGTW